MRALIQNFKKSEAGASLVEYAVALIVVTIIGGAGVITLANSASGTVDNSDQVVDLACDAAATAAAAAGGTEQACD